MPKLIVINFFDDFIAFGKKLLFLEFFIFLHIYDINIFTCFSFFTGIFLLFCEIIFYFGRKRITHFHLQPYSPTFRNRKSGALKSVKQKIFAAQTPPRKRGYVEDFALNMTFYPSNAFSKGDHLLLRCVHVTYGKIAARPARGWGWFPSKCFGKHGSTLMPCHVAVCVNFVLGSNVQFLCVITQSTGLVFLPSLPIGKKLGSDVTFLFIKKLCAKLYNNTQNYLY